MNDQVVSEILRMVQVIDEKLDGAASSLAAHMREEELVIASMQGKLSAIESAFPNDDFHGHKEYHASLIERNRWIVQLCKDVAREIAKYGLIGFLLWLGYHAWIDFLAGPK